MGKGKKGGINKYVKYSSDCTNAMRNISSQKSYIRLLGNFVGCYRRPTVELKSASDYSDFRLQCVDLPLIQSLVLCGGNPPDDFYSSVCSRLSKILRDTGIFSNIRPLPIKNYKISFPSDIRDSVMNGLLSAYPLIFENGVALFIRTLGVLLEYDAKVRDEFVNNIHTSTVRNKLAELFDYCYCMSLFETIYEDYSTLINSDKWGYDGCKNKYMPISAAEISAEKELLTGAKLSKIKESDLKTTYGVSKFTSSHLPNYSDESFKSMLCDMANAYLSYCYHPENAVLKDPTTNKIKLLEMEDGSFEYPLSYGAIYYGLDIDLEHFRSISTVDKYFDLSAFSKQGSEVYVPTENMVGSFCLKPDCISDFKNLSVASSLCTVLEVISLNELWDGMQYFIRALVDERIHIMFEYKELSFSKDLNDCNIKIRDLTSELRSEKREREKVEKQLNKANSVISEMNSCDSVLLKEGEVVVKSSEIDSLKSKIAELEGKLSDTQSALSKSAGKCEWQEKQISQLEEVVASYDNYDKELLELRGENIYLSSIIEKMEDLNKEDVDVRQKRFEEQLSAIKDIPILFVGGIGDMMSKFKDIFPNSDYIDVSDEGVNFSVPPRFQYVVLYTRSITHPHCYRVESQVPRERIIFMSMSNTELVVDELYKRIVNGGYSEV